MSTFAKYMDRYKNRLKTATSSERFPEQSSALQNELEQKRMANLSREQRSPTSNNTKLTTDRNAYIAFLQVQLERVTQSCRDIQRFQDKISLVESEVLQNSDKLNNAMKVIKLLQSCQNSQDQSILKLKDRLTKIQTSNNKQEDGLSPFEQKRKELSLQNKLAVLESKFDQLRTKRDTFSVQTASSFDKYSSDLNRRINDIQIEQSARIKTQSNQVLKITKNFQKQMQAALQKQGQDIASQMSKLQARMRDISSLSNTSRVDSKISPSQASNFGNKLIKIEGTLNLWLQKVEDQVNSIHNDLNSKADKRDFQILKRQFTQNLKSALAKAPIIPSVEGGKRASTPKQENINKFVSKEDLKQIKSQVNKNVQDGVDRMGNLVRQYLTSLQKLQKKVNVLQNTISRPGSQGVSPKHIITPKNQIITKQSTASSVHEQRPPIVARRQSSGRRIIANQKQPSSTSNKRCNSRSMELSRVNLINDSKEQQNGIMVGGGDLIRANKSRTLQNSPLRQSVSFNLDQNRQLARLGRRVQVGAPYSTKNSKTSATKPIIKRIYESQKKDEERQISKRREVVSHNTHQRQSIHNNNVPMRRAYHKSRPSDKDYDRSLSQGAKVLKDSLEKLSRSVSKSRRHQHQLRSSFERSRDSTLNRRKSNNRSFNRDLEQPVLSDDTSGIHRNSRGAASSPFRNEKQLSPIHLNRRVGGLINISRDMTPKNAGNYHSHRRDYSAPTGYESEQRGRLSNFNRSPLSRSACQEQYQEGRRNHSVSFRSHGHHDRYHSAGSHKSHSKKGSVSFSFSPYSTKRSRLGELQARLKRDKQLKQKMIQDLSKGHNSSVDTPKFHSKRNSASSAISRTLESQRKHSDRVNSYRTPKQVDKGVKSGAYVKKIPNSAASFKQKRAKLDNLYQEFAALADHRR